MIKDVIMRKIFAPGGDVRPGRASPGGAPSEPTIRLDDVTTDPPMTTEAILDAFATANGRLPRIAVRQAVMQWREVGPVLLDMLNRAANPADVSERDEAILFFGIFVMAQLREKRAFEPLCAICTQGDRIERLIGDGVTENLSSILARIYNGNLAPLHTLIEAVTADEFARDAALESLAWLTAATRIDRNETATYLRNLYVNLQPQATSQVWVGWQQAIALLGLQDLAPLVEKAFGRCLIDEHVMSIRHFHDDLREALQAAVATAPFASHMRNLNLHDDAVALLSTWHGFRSHEEPKAKLAFASTEHRDNANLANPFRGVGRNDRCPCGSGKSSRNAAWGKPHR
jgi:hypothetical protein